QRRSPAPRARRTFLRRDDKWLGRDAFLCFADPGAGSLGHRRLHSRLANQSAKSCCGFGQSRAVAVSVTNTSSRRTPMIQSFNPPNFSDFQKRSLIVGIVFLVGLIASAFFNPRQFFQSYLIGWTFCTGICVGSLALLMLQHMTGGGWGLVIRRVLEAATRLLPVMAILFLPVILGSHSIYHEWLDPQEVEQHAAVQFKIGYLNLRFFTVRAVVYFAVWIALAYLLNKWSLAQDRTADNRYTKQMRVLSGPGMVALIFTVTFASIDWYMSLEPEWFSTIYGFIYVAAWTLSALAFVIAVMANLSADEPMRRIVAPLHFHDLGKLLLALVMLWAYF